MEIESNKLDISLIFETLNYRGKQLSKLELFKNRLIYLVKKKYPGDRAETLRRTIIRTWLDIYEWLGKNIDGELDDDEFLRAFWIMFYDHSQRKDSDFNLFEQDIFENKYKIVDIQANDFLRDFGHYGLDNLLNSLSEAIKFWFFIHFPSYDFKNDDDREKFRYSPEIKRFLERLKRIPNRYGIFFKPLILAYFVKEEDHSKIEELLKRIERHNYCVYLFAGRQADTNRAHFSRLVNTVFRGFKQHGNLLGEINNKTDDWLRWRFVYEHIHSNRANNKKFSDWNGIKYTLWDWEQFLRGSSQPELEEYRKAQTYMLFPDEGHYFRDPSYSDVSRGRNRSGIDKLCYSLGNLSIGRSARAPQPFPILAANLRNGGYCEKDVAENYAEWTDTAIFRRGLQLLDFIEARWDITYQDIPNNDLPLRRKQLLLDGAQVDD